MFEVKVQSRDSQSCRTLGKVQPRDSQSYRTLGESLFYQPLFTRLVRGDFNPGVSRELNVAAPWWTDETKSWLHTMEEETQTAQDCTDVLGTEGETGAV